MNIPTDIWILIAGDDARLWNMLVRTIPGLHSRALMEKMKAKFEYTYNNHGYGSICGLLHTSLRYHRRHVGGSSHIMMNYGLLSNICDEFAANIATQYMQVRVYAVKGIPTRSRGPAIMILCRKTSTAMDLYVQDGALTKIDYFAFANSFNTTLVSMTPDNFVVTYYNRSHRKDVDIQYPQCRIESIVEGSKKVGGFSGRNENAKRALANIGERIANAIDNITDGIAEFGNLLTAVTAILQEDNYT